jgi:hypothetical protein
MSGKTTQVHLLHEPRHIKHWAGNLPDEKPCLSMAEFHTGLWMPEVSGQQI